MVANLRVEEWHAVHQQLRSIARRRAELDAEEARCLRHAERIQLWRRLGYVHMGEYLERELGYGPHAGAERMRVARALGDLPQIEAALSEGELHYSAVRELSRIAIRETEAAWLAAARGKNLRQVEAAVSGRKRGDRPDDPTSPELVNRVVRLELSPDVFALFRQTQAALADEHGGRLDDSAFIQALCRCALEGAGPIERARPAHQIAITVCESCKRGWQNGAGREIEVGPDVIERAQCDAELIGSLEAAQPARVTSTVTPRLRRQVLARDHHCCTVPGCRSARNLDLHHIQYQSDDGGHGIANLTTLCTGHHQRLHEGALVIQGRAPDGLEFTWRTLADPAIGHGQSHGGREAGLHAQGIEVRDESVEPGESHVGREAGLHAQGIDVRDESVEPGESHMGREAASHAQGIAVCEPGESRVGREGGSQALDIAALVEPVDRQQPHVGPEGILHAPDSTAPVERALSHRELGRPARPTAESATSVARDTTGTALTQRRSFGVASPGAQDAGASQRGSRLSDASSVDDEVVVRDVRAALTTAGYKPHEARRAVDEARSRVGPGATLEQLLREALRCCVRSVESY